jgi:hypothetical protein
MMSCASIWLMVSIATPTIGGDVPPRSNPASAQNPGRKQKDCANQFENAFHRDPHDPERQQKHPDDRIQNQQDQSERPAKDQQEYPQ